MAETARERLNRELERRNQARGTHLPAVSQPQPVIPPATQRQIEQIQTNIQQVQGQLTNVSQQVNQVAAIQESGNDRIAQAEADRIRNGRARLRNWMLGLIGVGALAAGSVAVDRNLYDLPDQVPGWGSKPEPGEAEAPKKPETSPARSNEWVAAAEMLRGYYPGLPSGDLAALNSELTTLRAKKASEGEKFAAADQERLTALEGQFDGAINQPAALVASLNTSTRTAMGTQFGTWHNATPEASTPDAPTAAEKEALVNKILSENRGLNQDQEQAIRALVDRIFTAESNRFNALLVTARTNHWQTVIGTVTDLAGIAAQSKNIQIEADLAVTPVPVETALEGAVMTAAVAKARTLADTAITAIDASSDLAALEAQKTALDALVADAGVNSLVKTEIQRVLRAIAARMDRLRLTPHEQSTAKVADYRGRILGADYFTIGQVITALEGETVTPGTPWATEQPRLLADARAKQAQLARQRETAINTAVFVNASEALGAASHIAEWKARLARGENLGDDAASSFRRASIVAGYDAKEALMAMTNKDTFDTALSFISDARDYLEEVSTDPSKADTATVDRLLARQHDVLSTVDADPSVSDAHVGALRVLFNSLRDALNEARPSSK